MGTDQPMGWGSDRSEKMEFDWLNPAFELQDSIPPRDIEEAFEDPFALRVVGSDDNPAVQSRYFCLGKTSGGVGLFSIYRSDGRKIRVIGARRMTEGENYFYERKTAEQL
jgi:uncharacterized protein